MFDQFTEDARAALAQGRQEMSPLQQHIFEPEHMLLGLLSRPEGNAVKILAGLGIDLKAVQEAIREHLPGEVSAAPNEKILLSPRSKTVIQQAFNEMHALQCTYLGTEHLLLGMLRDEAMARILLDLGVTVEKVRVQRAQLLKEATVTHTQMEGSAQPQLIGVNEDRQKLIRKYMHMRNIIVWLYALPIAALALVGVYFASSGNTALLIQGIVYFFSLPPLNFEPVAGWRPLQILAIFAITVGIILVVFFPYLYAVSFYLPLRYKLRSHTFLRWLNITFKSLFLSLIDLFLFFEVFELLLAIQPQNWWWEMALIIFAYSIMRTNLNPILRSALLYKLTPITDEKLVQQLATLTERAQTKVRGFYAMGLRGKPAENRHIQANAYVMGLGNTQRIVLTSSLLKFFPEPEVESILAHEIGHHVHHDLWRKLFVNSALTAAELFLFHLALQSPLHAGLANSDILDAFLFNFSNMFALVYLIFVGVLLLIKGYSRRREYYADEYALRLTGNVTAFKNSQIRLTNFNATPMRLSPWRGLFSTHPATQRRLEHADRFGAGKERKEQTKWGEKTKRA